MGELPMPAGVHGLSAKEQMMKKVALVVLVFQNSTQLLLMNYSRTLKGPSYISSTVVVCVEVVKLICSFALLSHEHGWDWSAAKIELSSQLADPWDTFKVGVPAFIYMVQNNLLFVATSNLDAATTQLTYQLKLMTTALFSVFILGKQLSNQQWLALVVLTAGVTLVQLGIRPPGEGEAHSSSVHYGSQLTGFLAVLSACLLSGFAAVYFEKILKGSKVSVWIRNIQLGAIGSVLALAGAYVSDGAAIAEYGFFRGYGAIVVLIIMVYALGGLTVAVVVKYADNILKGFATSFSVIVCALFSIVFLGMQPSLVFAVGAALVMASVSLYNSSRDYFGLNGVLAAAAAAEAVATGGRRATAEEEGGGTELPGGVTPNAPPLEQVFALLTSRHSSGLALRHAAALAKVASANAAAGGFHLRDLPRLVPVFEAAVTNAANASDARPYAAPLRDLLALAARPLRAAGASDELILFDHVVALVAFLAHAASAVFVPDAAAAAATALAAYDAAGRREDGEPLRYNQHAVSISGCIPLLVQALGRAMEAGDGAVETVDAIVDALLSLSCSLPSHCAQIADAGGIALAARLFAGCARAPARLEVLVELVWNVLEAVPEAHAQMDSVEVLADIRGVFASLLLHSRKRNDRHLRNEVLILATLLANSGYVDPNAFVAAGFTTLLLELACARETARVPASLPQLPLTALGCTEEDFEMKKLLWNLVLSTTTTPDGVAALISASFVRVLLMYLDPGAERGTLLQWTLHQHRELQVLATSLLFHLAAEVPAEFAAGNGPSLVIDAFVQHLDEPPPAALRSGLSKLVLNTAALFATQYGELGLVAVLLSILKDATLEVKLRRDAALTLSVLTAENAANQAEFLLEGGIDAVIALLNFDMSDPEREPTIVLAAIDCIWSAVVGIIESETQFLRADGVFALLDLLDTPKLPAEITNHGLGVILDLLDHPYTVAYVRRWRSGRDAERSVAHLLLEAWETSQAELGVALDRHGVIGNVDTPLAPVAVSDDDEGEGGAPAFAAVAQYGRTAAFVLELEAAAAAEADGDGGDGDEVSPAIADVRANMRAKVFALFCKLGFQGHTGLSCRHKTALRLILEYFKYKVGEVWTEIDAELEAEEVRPISPDLTRLGTMHEYIQQSAVNLQTEQRAVVAREQERELKAEADMYHMIMEKSRLMREAAAADAAAASDSTTAHDPVHPAHVAGPGATLSPRHAMRPR
ncbi:uncharacterized protein AMSG_12249 [Thecamonas trahens ATCC 50062]|uniref:Cilia- and flagella-associated protein 69 ARM repeats domain-containing protein n=1 Tax=Thecamonas trahens ATCC 50062 TaxID=461836 RepID=A0A0L0DLL8_THETB|nr:hypothetical protein AMSG_12249 [Thecamonas trahens ATCC 50062]KNC53204.1 hypothetical protein AMSG_12249 [Thecamonas trahens ATCC 50062]|eukprot:XP_013754703.1 hypothetical protein AMSG_12249 [Thecamonas trahens ATCC 50062]